MKDFFCLMNTLMNRSKNDNKSGGKGGTASSSSVGGDRLAVPFEASEDVRVLPGADSRKAKTALLSVLEPFLPLLPDLSGMELSEQKVLHNCLYSAGVTAALSLQKNGASATSALLNIDRESTEWKELFNSLGKTLDFDDSIDTYRKLSQKLAIPEELRSDTNGQLMKMITNEVAAFALTAFASMIYRRPFTKQMEVLMAPTQETDAVSTDDEGGASGIGDLSRSFREQSLSGHSSAGGASVGHHHHHSLSDTAAGGKVVSPACAKVRHAAPGIEEPHSNASSVAAFASTDGTEECDNEDADDDEYINEYIGDEDCLFRYVCSIGYEDLARLLMSLRQSTEFSHWSDSTPLMEACCGGYAGVVRALIEAGANINAQSSTKNTALTYACAAQHVECAKELLKSGKCDINLRNDSGHCALMEAASTGNVELLKILIEHGTTPLSVIDNHDFKNGRTDNVVVQESALTLASYKGHLEAVKYLISIFPQNVDDKNRDEEFHTALIEASMDGHVEVARALLEAGAKTNLSSESFESPLTLAACGGHVELVSLLLSFGARLEDVNDEGYTPLMEACREGHRDVVELLIDHGANVNLKVDGASETPLSLAASGGYLNIVELLVERGGDLTQGGPLYETLQEGHTDVACFIIQQLRDKVYMEEVQNDFNNSLMSAAELDNVIVCGALLSNNADPNCFSPEGRTPLMEAAKQGNMHIVDLLVKNNANVNLVSPNGEWTALSLACANGHDDIVRYLLDHGADPSQKLGDSSSCLLEATKNGHINCVEVLLDYKIPSVSRPASHIFDKVAKAKKHPNASVRPKPKGSVLPKDGAAKLESSQTTPPFVTKSTGISTTDNIYTDDEYTNVFAAIFQQQEQFIQQHLAQSSKVSKSTTASAGTTAGGTTPNANASQLFRALATAAAASPKYNGSDDYLFAQFVQRSLITTKKREAMTEDELNSFTEMIQQQFRTIFPSGQMDATALMANAQSGSDVTKSAKNASSTGETDAKQHADERLPKSPAGATKQCASNHTAGHRAPNLTSPIASGAQHNNRTRTRTPSPTPSTVSSRGGARSTTPNGAPPLCACCNAAAALTNDGANEDAATFSVSSTSNTTQNLQPPCDLALLDSQVDANADTALTVACVAGNVDIASMLIHRGFDIEHSDKKGFTPLILCATGGHVAICRLLLEAGCQVDAQADRTKDTALSLACSGGRKEIAELLLLFGANKEHRNISDYTPLSLAASGGYVDIIQMLLNQGAEINSRTGSKLGISPLMLAAMNGHEAATRLLLDNGSDINAQIETNRNTALTLACFQGRTEVVRLLLNHGANIDHRAKQCVFKTGLTPLMEAANGGYVDVGSLLLSAGADPNAAPVITSRDTALTIAADKGHASFVELVIRSGANVNARNKKGGSALWVACCGGHLETVRTLIKNGADADAQDNRKVSPLMIAFRKGHVTLLCVSSLTVVRLFNNSVTFEIVEFIVDYVTQFPSDQECDRYIATLTDQDLIAKCSMCFEYISRAKSKHAEQANKAAQSLLDMIAQEEAMAESKKRTKQRQKAKRKAKKNAAKPPSQLDDEDQEENEDEEDFKRTDDQTTTDEFQTAHEDTSSLRIDDDESIKTEALQNIAVEDMRVPCLNLIHESPEPTMPAKPSAADKPELEFLLPNVTNPMSSHNGSRSSSSRKATTGAQKTARRAARRARGGGGGGSQLADTKSTNATAGKAFDSAGATKNEETDSWVNPSKRRTTTTKMAKPASRSAAFHNVSYGKLTAVVDAMVPIDEWVADVSVTNTKRKSSQTLNVSSQSIARVIGRSGSNINAIREATNAHIEVEKMTTKREQATRLITIKGTTEAIRNSVAMIEMLIKEQDLHINDILRRVIGTTTAATAQHDAPAIEAPPHRVEHYCTTASHPTAAPAELSGGVTNVWQQRAAIREQQKVTSEVDSDKSTVGYGIAHEIPIQPPVDELEPQQQRPLLSQERKAPGYERPNSVANVGQAALNASSMASQPSLQPSSATGFASSSSTMTDTTLFNDLGLNDKDLPDFNKLLSGSGNAGGAGVSAEKQHQSISDIWNNCAAELPSPPTDLTDIFGNGILDSKTWLPSSTDIAAADRRAANSQRYDNNFSAFNGPSNANDWLGGIFPALGGGDVASTIPSTSSPAAAMKSMLANIGGSVMPASSASTGIENVQQQPSSSSKAHFSSAPNASRWDFTAANSGSSGMWNVAEDVKETPLTGILEWDLAAPANSPLPYIPKNFKSIYDPVHFPCPRTPAHMSLFGNDSQPQSPQAQQQQSPQQPQQPQRSTGSFGVGTSSGNVAYSSQFQPKFSANASVRGAAYSSLPLAIQKPVGTAAPFMSTQANPLYYVHGPQQQQYRRESVITTTSTPANGMGGYGMPFPQQQPFFQPQQQHFTAVNGPSPFNHQMMGQQQGMASKNQMFNGSAGSGFVHPPPGFIRQAASTSGSATTNVFYGGGPSTGPVDNGAKSAATGNNGLPTTQRNYYNFY